MPCSDHAPDTNDECVACLAADLLSFDVKIQKNVSTLKQDLKALQKRYQALAPKGDAGENCRCAIAYINGLMAAKSLSFHDGGQAIELRQIRIDHRAAYRQRLRAMGTWIGFTELHRLGVAFKCSFWIAIPSGNRWRRVWVGDPDRAVLERPGLRWTGNHYEVVWLTLHHGEEYDVTATITTNPRGDCAVESFLILLGLCESAVRPFMFGYSDAMRAVLSGFGGASGTRPDGGLIDHTDENYIAAITGCRAILDGQMSDDDVNQAIIAEGELPSLEEASEPKKEVKGGKRVAYVLAPTQRDYTGKPREKVVVELKDLTEMAQKDITYLGTKLGYTVHPKVIYTGHPDASLLAPCLSEAAAMPRDQVITFVLTAHGSPGIDGQIGMGNVPDGLRLTVGGLVEILLGGGLEKLKTHTLCFQFRCCNSAYVPLTAWEKSKEDVANRIKALSLIGSFHQMLLKLGFTKLTVVGFRGFYCPAVKGPTVSTKKSPGTAIEKGTVVIEPTGAVVFDLKNLCGIKGQEELDRAFS